jgi:hypothetical protein
MLAGLRPTRRTSAENLERLKNKKNRRLMVFVSIMDPQRLGKANINIVRCRSAHRWIADAYESDNVKLYQ